LGDEIEVFLHFFYRLRIEFESALATRTDAVHNYLQAPGLARLALIVRAADIKGQEQVAVEGIGLRAIAQGFAALGLSDEERLARQFPVYDALYEWARQAP
jgi:hypothetical protein